MKKLIYSAVLFLLLSTLLSHSGYAQIDMPQASPLAILKTKVGLTDVSIEYSRPGLKGRDKQIFGGLIPYDKVWRTGANASTKISFSDTVQINGKKLPAGTYALYTIPGRQQWTVIFSKNLELWGDMGYKEADDALRVKVRPTTLPYPKETFTIDISKYANDGAELDIIWDYTQVSVPLTVSSDDKVMAQIKEKTGGSYRTYYDAANYYLQTNRDLNQAEQWIDQALALRPHYAFHHLRAKILGAQGKTKEAVKAAELSRQQAAADNNTEYVKMNDALIASYNKSE